MGPCVLQSVLVMWYCAIIFNQNPSVFPMKLQQRCSTTNPSLFKCGHLQVSARVTAFWVCGFCRGGGMLAITNEQRWLWFEEWTPCSCSAQIVFLHFTSVRLFAKGCLHSHLPSGTAVVWKEPSRLPDRWPADFHGWCIQTSRTWRLESLNVDGGSAFLCLSCFSALFKFASCFFCACLLAQRRSAALELHVAVVTLITSTHAHTERRTPPLRETHEGRQGTDKTGEADTTTQADTWRETRHRQDRTTTQGDTWRETRHRQDRRGGHHHSGRHTKGDKWRETRHRQDRRGGHHHSERHMKGDTWRETNKGRQGTDKTGEADTTAQGDTWRETNEGRQGRDKTGEAETTTQGDTWRDKAQTRPERRTPPLRQTHEGRQMKGDKAQTRPERRTPPFRETHEGRQMKRQGTDKTGELDTTTQGDTRRETRHRQDRRGGHCHSGRHMKGDKWRHKAQTRPERRRPPLRETHEGRQGTDKTGEADTTTQADTWRETNEERQGTDKTGEADTTTQGDTWREPNEGRQGTDKTGEADTTTQRETWRETNEGRQGTDKTGEADTTTQGDTWRETRHRQDRRGRHHHSGRHMKGDKWRDKAQTRPQRRTPPLRETL